MAAIPADPAPLDSNDSKGHQQPSERVSICEEQRPQHESLEMPTQISPIASTSIKSRVVVPPINFSLVAPGIHRSGHPNKKNFSFLRRLKLKSIMYVEGSEEYRKDSMDFVVEEGIELFRYDLSKEDALFTKPGRAAILSALQMVLDTSNHPLLIHDDNGKSTTSLLVSLIRRFQCWSLTGIYAEGDMYAGPAGGAEGEGVGEAGREFIALFDPKWVQLESSTTPDWLR